MKGMTLAALAAAALLCGCADTSPANGQNTTAAVDRSDAPLGSYIQRKGGNKDSVTLDKQALENERQMGNGAINLPQR